MHTWVSTLAWQAGAWARRACAQLPNIPGSAEAVLSGDKALHRLCCMLPSVFELDAVRLWKAVHAVLYCTWMPAQAQI